MPNHVYAVGERITYTFYANISVGSVMHISLHGKVTGVSASKVAIKLDNGLEFSVYATDMNLQPA